MARGIWSGNISFGLVTIPVSVVSAENKSKALDFDLIDKRDKAHVGYQKINKNTGKVIDAEYIVKGLKLESGKYAIFEQDELDRLKIKGTSSIDIQQFVVHTDIDPTEYKKTYYLVPGKNGNKTYVLLRETLLNTNKYAVGLIVMHNRQQLVLIGANKEALILHTLHFAQEIKGTDELELPAPGLKAVKLSEREVKMAEKLVDDLTDKWKPEEYKDQYIQQVRAALKNKKRSTISMDDGAETEKGSKESLSNVLDLLPLLEKSLHKKTSSKSTKSAKRTRAHG